MRFPVSKFPERFLFLFLVFAFVLFFELSIFVFDFLIFAKKKNFCSRSIAPRDIARTASHTDLRRRYFPAVDVLSF